MHMSRGDLIGLLGSEGHWCTIRSTYYPLIIVPDDFITSGIIVNETTEGRTPRWSGYLAQICRKHTYRTVVLLSTLSGVCGVDRKSVVTGDWCSLWETIGKWSGDQSASPWEL